MSLMYLVDTNVISETRKPRQKVDSNVAAWFGHVNEATLFLSPVTIFELEIGIRRIAQRDARQAALLSRWLSENILKIFATRLISIDSQIALQCAQLHVPNPRSERDAWIAATALVHKMTLVTRNVKDFAATGVRLLNPWEPQG